MDAATFRAIRRMAGIRQVDLATRLQCSQHLISKYESGKTKIPADVAEWMTKLAQGKAGASPPKRTRVQSRKVPPAQQVPVKRNPGPPAADQLCGRCLCVTDRYIPCGCWSWAR